MRNLEPYYSRVRIICYRNILRERELNFFGDHRRDCKRECRVIVASTISIPVVCHFALIKRIRCESIATMQRPITAISNYDITQS